MDSKAAAKHSWQRGCALPADMHGGQGAFNPDDVAEAVLFCFRLSKNAVPEEVGFVNRGASMRCSAVGKEKEAPPGMQGRCSPGGQDRSSTHVASGRGL